MFGREHLPKPQPAEENRAEPPRGVQSSLALLFSAWELMAVENRREMNEGNELPPHLFLGQPQPRGMCWEEWLESSLTLCWHSLLAAVAWWDVHPIWEAQGLVEPRAAAQALFSVC